MGIFLDVKGDINIEWHLDTHTMATNGVPTSTCIVNSMSATLFIFTSDQGMYQL